MRGVVVNTILKLFHWIQRERRKVKKEKKEKEQRKVPERMDIYNFTCKVIYFLHQTKTGKNQI